MEKLKRLLLNIRQQHRSSYFVGGPMVCENNRSHYCDSGGNINLSLPLAFSDKTELRDVVIAWDDTYINAEFTFVAAVCNLWLAHCWED